MLQRFTVVLLSALLIVGGCRAPVVVPTDEMAEVLRPGDRLHVRHPSGAETRFVLDRVEDGALLGHDDATEVRVLAEDVLRVSRVQFVWGRTLLLLAIVVPVVVVGLVGLIAYTVFP